MKQCKGCGKKGLFLKLNVRGLCEDCAEKAKLTPKSGQIAISINKGNNKDIEKLGHLDEETACEFFIETLSKRGKDKNLFNIEHRSSEYTSLIYDKNNDFIRIKITDNVSWISLDLDSTDRKQYMNDPLFETQENKNQRHWRSYFKRFDDLEKYVDLAERACVSIPVGVVRELSDKEKDAIAYTFDYMVSLGADPDSFYIYILTHEVELIYKSWHCSIRYKMYKKKAGGRVAYRTIRNASEEASFENISEIHGFEKELKKTIKAADDDKYEYDMSELTKYSK